MFHRLSVEELIRRSSIPSEEACRSDFEEPATREILQERIRIHYITISRDYDLNQHEVGLLVYSWFMVSEACFIYVS